MKSIYSENYKFYTPYHVVNPLNSYKLNEIMLNNKSYLNNSFSQLGYQIMNPQFISYQLEPIYSTLPTVQYSKSISYKKIPKIEIGEPIERNRRYNNTPTCNCNYNRSISHQHSYRNLPNIDGNINKSDTQLILDKINKLEEMTKNNINNTSSTNNVTNNKNDIPYNSIYKNSEDSVIKSYNEIDDKKPPKIMTENVTPFVHFLRDSNNYRKKKQAENMGLNGNDGIKRKAIAKQNLKMIGICGKKFAFKQKTKRDWLGLFKQFINIYVFWSSAKKYSAINSQIRKNEIYIRTKHIVNDIAILKDWIISIEESFFSEFKNYEKFNSKLNSNLKGEKKQILKKNILNIINIFINNLESSLEEVPENVQSVLFEFIKKVCYFPKKYLSRFQINRIDFNFYGGTKNLNSCQSAMILSYLIIIGVFIQQILLHIKDIFVEYSNCDDMGGAVKNIGSILHYIVRDIFKQKQKRINDILALFNYYRSYHLYNKEIEKLKNKINSKINIEENDNDDEFIGLLLSYNEVKNFFEENSKYIEKFKDKIFNWSLALAKNLKTKFNKKEYISLHKEKKRSIKSTIYG